MKKVLVKFITVLTIGSFLISCNQNGASGGTSKPNQKPEVIENKFIVNNSRTDYSIVIPKNANKNEQMAAETVSSYLSKSSGAKFGIINDTDVATGMHYISLGNTSVFAKEFKNISMNKLDGKISTYFISTKSENIYIYSNPIERGEGTLNGAFDLLGHLINYEYYAADEVYYTNETTINLLNFKDFFIEPTFDGRSIGNKYLIDNQTVCDNYRVINQYRGTEWNSETYGHSQVTQFVRPDDTINGRKLYEIHSDWFSNKGATTADTTNNQLCWSAGPELEDYIATKFEEFLSKNKDATHFMFGQEDNSDHFCNCDRCQEAMRNGAINYAGLQIRLMNNVINKVEAWIEGNPSQAGRQVRYVVFGYHATKEAPCVDKNGKWVPANSSVVPHKKLYVLYAPIECNFAYPLENQYFNVNTLVELKQWNALMGGRVMVYLYDTNFSHYFVNFYNFSSVKAMYQTCKKQGVSYLYTQGATDTNTSCFADMRNYIESKLMWDISLNYEDLVKDFINHYYYEAADDIYEYYRTVKDRLAKYHIETGSGGSIYMDIANETIYPYSVLRYFTKLFDQAMEKIEKYQDINPDFYSTLKARIMREYLSVIYLKITLAKTELTSAEKAEMKEIFKTYTSYFSITRASEGGTDVNVDTLFD